MNVKLEDISMYFGAKKALNNVNLSIPEGSFVVILGPSGSGKTTLLRIIAGLQYPTSGKVYFDDKDVTDLPANKRNIAMAFQNYPLFPHMTVEENMRFALESKKKGKIFKENVYSAVEITDKVKQTLELLHITEHRNKYPSQLSGGEKQRVAIGREVIRDPCLFLFDEPLSNIDARLRYEMRTWIRRLHKLLGKTMIYVTHDQDEAMALGEMIILLEQGKIQQSGKKHELYYEPKKKFVAEFIGNYPMNFINFEKKGDQYYVVDNKKTPLPVKLANMEGMKKLEKGEIGFRAEYIREYKKDKLLDDKMVLLHCKIEDIEKVLEQQILSLRYNKYKVIFVTDTKKEFSINQELSVIINLDDLYIFDSNGKRVEEG